MEIVKYLIVFVLTLLLLALLASSQAVANPPTVQTTVIFIYCLLIYLVWPVGTSYSAVAFNRFYIVMGIGTFLAASYVVLNNQCPTFPFSPVPVNYQASGIAAAILFACIYLGKVPTSLLLCLLGGRLLYMGYTKKPNPSFKRDTLKRAP
ncbi:hypothetical protein [Methylotenera sp. G11]|uniref:hypothetical protein n=1 Tax=Methylotenera sp. G11 TaxID=1506585 RepID=UPI001269B9DF|nr:hypothetical protein [Methylotenera sp. G11]